MVGQLLSLGIPNLNKVYEDDKCTVLLFKYGEDLLVHVDIVQTSNKEYIQHYYEVIETLFEQLRERGIKEVKTWVREGKEMDFAQFYGFDQFEGELMFYGKMTLDPTFYVLKKVL